MQTKKIHSHKKCKLSVYNYIKQGLAPVQISKLTNFSKRKVYYAVKVLKKEGYIKMISPGVWEVTKTHHDHMNHTPIKKKVRGHGMTITLKVNKLKNWHQRERLMLKAGIPFDRIPQGQRVQIDNVNIWLTKKSIVFYLPYSWFGETAQDTKDQAMNYLLNLITSLEKTLKVSTFKIGGRYHIKFKRQHYALVRNILAKQYNKEHKKLRVYDNNGLWLEIDNSLNLNELETYREPDVNKQVQDAFNDIKDGITPRFLMERVNDLFEDRSFHAKNINAHVGAIKDLRAAVNELRNEVKKLRKCKK